MGIVAVMDTAPLKKACEIMGGQAALGRALGRSQSTVWNWLQRGIPSDECPAVEAATNGAVTRYDLRPDVFGPPPQRSEAA